MPFDNDRTPPRTSDLSDQNHLSNTWMADDAKPTDESVVEYPSNFMEAEELKLICPSSRGLERRRGN